MCQHVNQLKEKVSKYFMDLSVDKLYVKSIIFFTSKEP